MRSSPKPSFGHGLSDSTYSTADCNELPTVARELLALGLDDLGRSILEEAIVREHPFGARDLFLQTFDLCGRVAVVRPFGRFHDRVEDPPLLALELRQQTAAPEDDRGFLHHAESARLG